MSISAIRGPRSKRTAVKDSVKENWAALEHPKLKSPTVKKVSVTRSNISAWLQQPVAPRCTSPRDAQDQYARQLPQTLTRKTPVLIPISIPCKNNVTLLERDEYHFRKNIADKPQMLSKAPLMFGGADFTMKMFFEKYGEFILGKKYIEGQTLPTLTLFNSCARSDGAAAVIVASEQRAKDLRLDIIAELKSWAFWGNNPSHMGIAPAFAADLALKRAGISFSQLDDIELHEAFAATCLSIFRVGKEKFGQNWDDKLKQNALNPHGGTIALGHPLAATGTRIVLNALYQMKANPDTRWALATACAAGGLGGAIVLERY